MNAVEGKSYFSVRYERLLFGIAALWNLAAAAVLFINPEFHLARLGIVDPNAQWLARSLASSAAAWGIGYLLVAIDARRFRNFIWLGAISKTLFALVSVLGLSVGQMTISGALPGLVDLVFAALFIERIWRWSVVGQLTTGSTGSTGKSETNDPRGPRAPRG